MEPAYRDGNVIVVSPAAPVRRGDRVVVKTKDGEVMAKELKRKTAKTIELRSLNPEHGERTLCDRRRAVDRAHRVGESNNRVQQQRLGRVLQGAENPVRHSGSRQAAVRIHNHSRCARSRNDPESVVSASP